MNDYGKKALEQLKSCLCDLGFEVESFSDVSAYLSSGGLSLLLDLKYRTELRVSPMPDCDLLPYYEKKMGILPLEDERGDIKPLFLEEDISNLEVGVRCVLTPRTMALRIVAEIKELLEDKERNVSAMQEALEAVSLK